MSYFDGWHLQLTTIGDICNIRNSCDVSKIGSADSKWYELRIGILALAGHHGIGCTGKHILYVIHFVVCALRQSCSVVLDGNLRILLFCCI